VLHDHGAAVANMVKTSADRSLAFLKSMQGVRTIWVSSTVTPDNPEFLRDASGNWTGTYTMPDNLLNFGLPYTPVLLTGPLWFPLIAGSEVTFQGFVDVPFASLEGFAGIRYLNGDPAQGIDPSTAYAADGNWGTYYVIVACNGATQARVRVASNRFWTVVLPNPPSGTGWTFQLVTYHTAADDAADTNRQLLGNPWDQQTRGGDIRTFWTAHYTPPAAQLFLNVTDVPNPVGDGTFITTGDIDPTQFTPTPGCHYRVLVTEEVDVEYAQMILDVVGYHFTGTRDFPFTGKMKLRLIEFSDASNAPLRHVPPVWDQDNAAAASAFIDLRMEYYSIAGFIPGFPGASQPARLDHTWSLPHVTNTIGRVQLVDLNTKRVLGQHTMSSGLARSYNVPAAEAGQTTSNIYYDGFLDTCFLYDQAVILIAYIQQGEWTAAQHIIDGLLLVQNEGGSWPFAANQFILTGDNYTLLRTGAIAWVIYALLIADQPEFRGHWSERTNTAATDGLKFLIWNYLNTINLLKGGLDQNGLTPWWSTEHNIDAWWCLDLADRLYGSADFNWRYYADGIKSSLLTYGWDTPDGVFWQGGGHEDDTVNDGSHAFDMHSWGAVILEKWGLTTYRDSCLARGWAKYYCTDNTYHLSGFTTFIPEDGYPPETVLSPWCEGSFGMVVALRNSQPKRAFGLLATMARGQLADGSYRYTLQRDPVEPIETFPCGIGPAWNIVALSGIETPNKRIIWT
jgi:hypothetical protein